MNRMEFIPIHLGGAPESEARGGFSVGGASTTAPTGQGTTPEPPADPSSKKIHASNWVGAETRSYQGNFRNDGSYPGAMGQGRASSMGAGPRHGITAFGGSAYTGDDKGKTMSQEPALLMSILK